MNAEIHLEAEIFAPGSLLRGRASLPATAKPIVFTVEWVSFVRRLTTHGWPDEWPDGAEVVHREELPARAERREHVFAVELPLLPLSYEGQFVMIGWRVAFVEPGSQPCARRFRVVR